MLAAELERICRGCGEAKPRSAYATQTRRGRQEPYSRCKSCRNASRRLWYAESGERARTRQREYERETHRRAWLKRYGLTPEAYDALVAEQGGLCAICREPQAEHAAHLDVDHCHRTGVVRGLLCRRCNTALGSLRDDPALLLAAMEYLARHR